MRFISLVPTFLLSLPIICPSVNALPRFSREILAQRGAHSGRVSTDLAVRQNAFDLRQLANVKRSGDEENCGCQDGNGSSSGLSPFFPLVTLNS
ncbi:hypothetical protein BDP27DRAFT_152350 [Rhodocollybia butyracea]|uniref:Uncharacterized protein n=1 Tax=Rhodocollybia butyracea TaxID=206335 RepID=A0A9P5Q5L0_9AGAR|nr:hypothetical protein BDP27DRAFT_152350 [Rhodocollybia butyracea]